MDFVRRTGLLTGIVLFASCALCAPAAQVKVSPPTKTNGYSNTGLGFRYTRPSGMRDKTERFTLQFEDQPGTTRAFRTLLAMSSGPDSSVPNWCSVTIVTYLRNAVSERDDAKAAAQTNAWVAHSKDASALPKSVVLSGQSFTVSVFGLQEGTVKKGAVVWTTIRKGKLLSFAFAANNPEQLNALAETMKSVQFFEPSRE